MKVSELIEELKKMPQHLEVGFAAHDHDEWEVDGWPRSVHNIVKNDYQEPIFDKHRWGHMPNEYVVIRG